MRDWISPGGRASLGGHAWLAYLALAGASLVAYLLLPQGGPRAILYVGVGALAAVAILVGIRLHRPAARAGWWLMLASQVAAAVGDLFWVGATADVRQAAPVVSAADPFYVAEFGLLALSGVAFIRGDVRRQPARLLDVIIAAIGFGTLVWAFSVGPFLARPLILPDAAATVVAYAVVASVLVGVFARVAVSAGSQTPAAVMILAALGMQAIGYGAYTNADTYRLGDVSDVAWLAFASLRAAASLHPSMTRLGSSPVGEASRLPPVTIGLVAFALVMPLAVVLASSGPGRQDTLIVVAVATTVLALAVFIRTLELLRDVRAQAARLRVIADLQRLDQVLLNLCSNAVKNNVRGGRVDVSCRRVADGRVEIAVSDTGIGIPTEMLPRIFEPFERLGAEASAGVGGTGLGLALSKALVEGMGGTIAVESTVERGSTFRVVFHAADDPTAAA